MSLLSTARAHDPAAAARSAVVMFTVSAVALIGWTVLDSATLSRPAYVFSWSVVPLLLAAALIFRLAPTDRLDRMGAYTGTALVGVLLVCALRVVTDDSSIGAHAFLILPVLWAASHLQRAGVVLVTGAALTADAFALLRLLPVRAALSDLVFSGVVLVVVASVLHRAAGTHARLVQALREQADIDALTGLVNRHGFDAALHRSASGDGAALVLIDIDAFKTINDLHGHPAGDQVLVHLASVVRELVRSDDAVVSRLGGDELAVLLPGCTTEVAARRAEALIEAVRVSPVALPDGGLVQLSISVGVAHVAARGDDQRALHDHRALYSAADAALYDAKRSGRGRMAVAGA